MNHCIFQEDILFILFTLNIKLHTEGSSNLSSLRLIALKFKSSTRAEELNVLKCTYFMQRLHKHQKQPRGSIYTNIPTNANNYRPPLIIYTEAKPIKFQRIQAENTRKTIPVWKWCKNNMETKKFSMSTNGNNRYWVQRLTDISGNPIINHLISGDFVIISIRGVNLA